MRKIWGLPYEDEYSGVSLRKLYFRRPFYQDGSYMVTIGSKMIGDARRNGIQHFILFSGDTNNPAEIGYLNVPSKEEIARKDKEYEFEDKPSMFDGSPPMRLYKFKIKQTTR